MTYLLLQSGSDTVNLTADGVYLMDYVPRYDSNAESLTESIDVRITGTSSSAIADKIRSIERFFELTKNYYDNRQGVPCYLLYQADSSLPVVQSRLLNGRVIASDKLSHYKLLNKSVDVGLVIERLPFWESFSETELPLTNGNGTNVTGGINVFNCNDGSGSPPNKRNNYVQISGSHVGGNLPAPVRVWLQNLYDSSNRISNLYLSQNVFSNPSSFTHIIEGERAAWGGSNVASSGASAGYYRNITWSGNNQTIIARYSLPSSIISNGGGRYFKIYAALMNSVSNTYIQARITFPSGYPITIIQEDQEILIPTGERFIEIGTLQIPPWLIDQNDLYSLDLSLYGRKSGGGALAIDFLYLMPAESFVLWKPRGYGLAHTTQLTVDYIEDQSYVEGYSPGGKASIYMLFGKPITLIPNRTQRLYFQQSGDTGDLDINRKILVRVFYRARYGTL